MNLLRWALFLSGLLAAFPAVAAEPQMRAARLHEAGRPLRVDSIERPKPRAEDVLVQVKSCGVIPNMNVIFSGTLWRVLNRP